MEESTNPETGVEADDTHIEAFDDEQADEIEEVEAEEPETDEEQEESPEDDFEEVDYEGEKYSVPKKLKDAFLRQSDYTQKTQKLAEQSRDFEQQKAMLAQERQLQAEFLDDIAQIRVLDQQLAQYKAELDRIDGLDWSELSELDLMEQAKLDRQYRQLKETRDNTANQVIHKTQQREAERQRNAAKLIAEGNERLAKEIPDWSPKKAGEIRQYGVNLGYSEQQMASITNPRDVLTLHKAMLWDKHLEKATSKPKSPPPQPVKAVKPARSRPAPTEYRVGMSDAEYDEWRARQSKRKR